MAKKQPIIKETAAVSPPARAANPKSPRVKAAQHSKTVSVEPVGIHEEVVHTDVIHPDVGHTNAEQDHQMIAQIAYGYWESRGYQGGTAVEDWLRAEHEYRQRLAATRL